MMTIIGLYMYIHRVQRCFYRLLVYPRATVVPLGVCCAHGHLGAALSGQKAPGRSGRSILALGLSGVWTTRRCKRWGLYPEGQCIGTSWLEMGGCQGRDMGTTTLLPSLHQCLNYLPEQSSCLVFRHHHL